MARDAVAAVSCIMTEQSVMKRFRDPAAKKRLILEASRRLLERQGFQDVSLDLVAREAGVAKGTLFLHYKDKEDLFAAVFADLVDQLGAELEALAGAPERGRRLLEQAAGVILGHFDRHRDFMAQFSLGRFPGCGRGSSGKLMEKFRANGERVRGILARAARDGGASCPDLEFAVAAFFSLCRSAAVRKLLHGGGKPLAREAGRVVDFFLKGSGLAA